MIVFCNQNCFLYGAAVVDWWAEIVCMRYRACTGQKQLAYLQLNNWCGKLLMMSFATLCRLKNGLFYFLAIFGTRWKTAARLIRFLLGLCVVLCCGSPWKFLSNFFPNWIAWFFVLLCVFLLAKTKINFTIITFALVFILLYILFFSSLLFLLCIIE